MLFLLFCPVWVLGNAVILDLAPRNGQIVLFLVEDSHTFRETVYVADGLLGVYHLVVYHSYVDTHRLQRIGLAIHLLLCHTPSEEIPVGGFLESHFHTTLVLDVVECWILDIGHVNTLAGLVDILLCQVCVS